MKLWQKIFLGSFITSVFIFFFLGFYIVAIGLHFNLERETERTNYYQSIYETKTKDFITKSPGTTGLNVYLDNFREELEGDGRYIQVYENDTLIYDGFQKFPPEPHYTFQEGQAAYTPSYMKDIGDSRFLYVESTFPWENSLYKFVMIKDLSEIYQSCDVQLTIFCVLCLFQAFLTATIMFLITKTITAPIEQLNEAVNLMAKDSIPIQLSAEGEDEISELSRNFNKMSEAINRSMDEYKQIIGNLTHEIKTPLTSIIGYTELLKEHPCTGEIRDQALSYILEEGKRLHSITKKMISLSRIQPEFLTIERQSIDKIIEISLMTVRIKADQKHILFHADKGTGIFCYADKALMITLIENILDNAIKASHDGGRINIFITSKNHILESIKITDYGKGIPEEIMDKIQQPFFTGDKAHSPESDGFGMGLTICRLIMQHHHGTIKFESKEGKFTAVTLEFPVSVYEKLETSFGSNPENISHVWQYETFNVLH